MSEPTPLTVCAHCKALAANPEAAFCALCGRPLECQRVAEEEFYPLLLAIGIERHLRLNESALCDLHLRNLDAAPIRDVAMRIESRSLKEPWESTVRCVERGQREEADATAELLPLNAGKIVLQFRLAYTDARGARRSYEGGVRMAIRPPSETRRQAQVTLSITNSKVMGTDLSQLIRFEEPREETVGGEELCRMPVKLSLAGLERPAAAPEAAPAEAGEAAGDRERYCLEFSGAEAGRRVLLLALPELTVGMHKYTKNPRVGLTVRLLPCRSEAQDPENWRASRQLSSPHAAFAVRDGAFFVRDEPDSKNGTYLFDPEKMPTPGAEATAPGWRRLEKGAWTALPERTGVSLGRGLLMLEARVYRSRKGPLYALGLRRLNNAPELEYVQVARRVYLGSSERCPVRLREGPPLAACLDWTGDGFQLIANAQGAAVKVDGRQLAPGAALKLERPCVIEIGAYRWTFGPARVEDFCETKG